MLRYLEQLLPPGSAAFGLAALALAVTLGLTLGAIRVRGVKLGVSGVLFVALLFGQLGLTIDGKVLEFLRDFSLILFVYAIGLQVGPGFVASLRAEGLRLNFLSVVVVAAGALMTAGVIRLAHLPRTAAAGLYAGAYTTTPGLASGQEALRRTFRTNPAQAETAASLSGLAYTVAYPFGMIGPVLVIAMLRRLFRVEHSRELQQINDAEQVRHPPIEAVDFEVTQHIAAGIALSDHPVIRSTGVKFSRMLRGSILSVPHAGTLVQIGDIYRAFGPRPQVAAVVAAMGKPSDANLSAAPGDVKRADLIVTKTSVLRRPLRELDLIRRTGVTLGRVVRAGVELAPSASFKLQFGDRVIAIGPEAGLKLVEAELGNCPDSLNRPQLIPIFLGIVLGVVVGCVPLAVPGLSARLRIGLAGGPMLAAIALSQLGSVGSMVWYMPAAANQLFRDFGLAVFLACVGFSSGDHFFQRVAHGGGLTFVLWGAAITILPVFLVGIIARTLFKINFLTLSGWVAGAMTSSPALLFADELAQSDAPAVAYAAVAPLAMLTPILCSQLLVAMML